MPDITDKHTRSRMMSGIRGKGNRSTEWKIRALFVRLGYRGWVMHPKDVIGKPDVAFPRKKIAVFVDGCFWHKCPRCALSPDTNRAFWERKLTENRKRDFRINRLLGKSGWRIVRIWEHAISSNRKYITPRFISLIQRRMARLGVR